MSWDHTRYEATCKTCGNVGVCINSSDDWGRSETTWEGFSTKPADSYLVDRMKIDALKPVCHCGSTDIEVVKQPTN